MFDCCRVPNEGLDWSVSYATPGDLGNSGHIIVLRKNRVWKVEVTKNGQLLSTQEIEKQVLSTCRQILCLIDHTRQIQYIYDNTLQEYPGVGVLTASNRDVWSKVCIIHLPSVYVRIQEALFSGLFRTEVEGPKQPNFRRNPFIRIYHLPRFFSARRFCSP